MDFASRTSRTQTRLRDRGKPGGTMRHRFYVLLAAALGSACAGQKGQTQPTVDKQRITNVSYFDLANCSPRSLNISAPVTQPTVVGFLIAARPQILECLVDPKSRGPAN